MMTTETNDNSGGTVYSAGNDFTIKPLTTTVDIKLVRRLMATWHTNGLTDSNIRKILLLYFGEPAWMNLDKVYDRNMFGQIAKGMNFHSRQRYPMGCGWSCGKQPEGRACHRQVLQHKRQTRDRMMKA